MSEVASVNPPRVPVSIVTGFLGAGKTSVLNHVLTSSHGRRIAVVVNDFGRINIDAELVQKSAGDVVSLENGCICCSLSDGLITGVARLVRQDSPPQHIIVETSGVSDPLDLARAFTDPELQRFAPLDGIVTVVDCELKPPNSAANGWSFITISEGLKRNYKARNSVHSLSRGAIFGPRATPRRSNLWHGSAAIKGKSGLDAALRRRGVGPPKCGQSCHAIAQSECQ